MVLGRTKLSFLLAFAALIVTGCDDKGPLLGGGSTATPASSTANASASIAATPDLETVTVSTLRGPVNVLPFESFDPGLNRLECRDGKTFSTEFSGEAEIAPPHGTTFAEYLRQTLIANLGFVSDATAPDAPTVSGRLDSIEFYSQSGYWVIEFAVETSAGESRDVEVAYNFTNDRVVSCEAAAAALVPAMHSAVRLFIGYASASFRNPLALADMRVRLLKIDGPGQSYTAIIDGTRQTIGDRI